LLLYIINTARFEEPSHDALCSILLGCDTVLQGKRFLTLQRTNFRLLDPEHESTNILQNIENYLTNNTAPHPGRLANIISTFSNELVRDKLKTMGEGIPPVSCLRFRPYPDTVIRQINTKLLKP
jgi:hypothetical protein